MMEDVVLWAADCLLLPGRSRTGFARGPGRAWSCQRRSFHRRFLAINGVWVWGRRSWLENEWIFLSRWEVAKSGCMQQQIQWAHSLLACVPRGSLMEYSVYPKLWDIHCFPRLPKRGHSPSSRRSQLWAWVFCERPPCPRMATITL